jgi:copper chaperone CopZ
MKKNILLAFLVAVASCLFAQENMAELKIRTSAICETCKKTIEHDMSFEKGVKSVKLDLDSNVVVVVYNPAKTDENKIRLALTKAGYDADSLKADPKAIQKLPKCCRPDGGMHK